MDTTRLYKLQMTNGIYPVELGYRIKDVYDETELGDLVPVRYGLTEIPEGGRAFITLFGHARGPLRVKYKKAK